MSDGLIYLFVFGVVIWLVKEFTEPIFRVVWPKALEGKFDARDAKSILYGVIAVIAFFMFVAPAMVRAIEYGAVDIFGTINRITDSIDDEYTRGRSRFGDSDEGYGELPPVPPVPNIVGGETIYITATPNAVVLPNSAPPTPVVYDVPPTPNIIDPNTWNPATPAPTPNGGTGR